MCLIYLYVQMNIKTLNIYCDTHFGFTYTFLMGVIFMDPQQFDHNRHLDTVVEC